MSEFARPVLSNFRSATIRPPLPQQWLLDHTAWLMAEARAGKDGLTSEVAIAAALAEATEKIAHYGVSRDLIRQRQICVLPPLRIAEDSKFYPERFGIFGQLREKPEGPTLDERMKLYREVVDEYLKGHYAPELPPDDVVHVTTTGYLLPSPVQRMIPARRWDETRVTHSYHMGCYGAFPAVRTAAGLLAADQLIAGKSKKRVDLLHTEASSIHLDPTSLAGANLVTATLFGDGFISYSLYPESEARAANLRGLRLLSFHEQIIPDSAEDMKLTPGARQFDMHLSLRVPVKIRANILPFVEELCRRAGVAFSENKDRLFFAIHPGGTKILQVVAEALMVDEKRMAMSAEVLRECGNMASASIPHIWQRIIDDTSVPRGSIVVSAGFGPGLTVTGLVLQKV